MPRGCTVIQWITDFSHRVSQLQEVSRLVSQGGAKEIKVRFNLLELLSHIFILRKYATSIFCCVIPRVSQFGSEAC